MLLSHKLLLILVLAVVAVSTGCTHTQLRFNHTRQARTLTGIYEKQVLDNLAMFSQNPQALPFFAVPKAGTAQVTDSGALSASPLNGPGHTILNLASLSRNNTGSWTIEPVSDPQKLKLMRCAYRRAIGLSNPNDPCINCCEEQQDWAGAKPSDTTVCCNCCQIRKLNMEHGKCFFGKPCEKVGSYCGHHIRLCPDKHTQDSFTQLVLTIMDYAVNEPRGPYSKPTMDVEHYHYKMNDKREYVLDGQGRFVIESIDKFTADAHAYTVPIEEEGMIDDADPATVEMRMRDMNRRTVIPRERSVQPRDTTNRLLEGAIDTQQRKSLFLLPSVSP